jgi:hypothetical protein
MNMKITSYLPLAALVCLAACNSNNNETQNDEIIASNAPALTLAWETDTTLITPESVIYDAQNDVFYVSCIGAMPPEKKDGDGYIAKIGANGEIIENKWIAGLDAPKGMAISGETLYVADIDKLVAIDIKSGKVLSKTLITGATFLNDADAAPNGDIYLTDSDLNTVFVVSGPNITELYKNEALGRLNGIFVEDDRSLLLGFNSGKLFTLSDTTLTEVAQDMPKADGIERYGNGYFTSGWDGEIYHLDNEWNKTKVLDTKEEKVNAADIKVVESKNLLLVPGFFANKIVAYTIN